ncbi:uncharacterized protein LOC134856251 isoform X1 [Symsagittifera roscoffensis]|uniref:uncharacterized protein LOC134856251 isoform X1 n=1 Tax=Symsagittifera roscoffensis TaxID=84072 RepID=UPI00307BFCC0
MTDSRCQKNFYQDSGLNRGTGKRAIRPQQPNENDFFSINYEAAEPRSGTEPPVASGPSSVPWGTSADVKHTAVGDELAMLGAGANHNSRKQSRDQNSQVSLTASMNRQKEFYDQNPECKPVTNHHREAMLAEKNKPAPWGTQGDFEAPSHQEPERHYNGNGNMSVPWGTTDPNAPHTNGLSHSGSGGNNSTRKQYLDQKSQMTYEDSMNRQRDFYDQNPESKPAINQHREAMLAEKNKPVPWGTLQDLGGTADGYDQGFKGKRKGSSQNGHGPAPPPFATAFNDELPANGRKGGGSRGGQQAQQSSVQSQITF